MLNFDNNRKLRFSGYLTGSSGIYESYQETQEFRIPEENSVIQRSWQKQFKIVLELKHWDSVLQIFHTIF